jgi:hypothetical protein
VIGDLRMVMVDFTFSTYATNGKAFAPSLFGLVEYRYAFPGISENKAWYVYDGTTLECYTDADSEAADAADLGSARVLIIGK